MFFFSSALLSVHIMYFKKQTTGTVRALCLRFCLCPWAAQPNSAVFRGEKMSLLINSPA